MIVALVGISVLVLLLYILNIVAFLGASYES
jgi:hypothetical protein